MNTNDLPFLTWEQMLTTDGRRFFVEIYRNGEYQEKGFAKLLYTGGGSHPAIFHSVMIDRDASNGSHGCWTLGREELVDGTKFSLWGRDDDFIQLKPDRSPLPAEKYSYQNWRTSQYQ